MSRLVTIGEASRELGVSSKTLRRYEERGLLKPIRTMGGQRRYYLSTLRDLLKSAVENEESQPNAENPHAYGTVPLATGREPSVWDAVEEERASFEALRVRALRDDFVRVQREDAERAERERKSRAEAEIRLAREQTESEQSARERQTAEAALRSRFQFELSLAEMRLLAEPREAHGAIRKALHSLLSIERIPSGTASHHISQMIQDEIDNVAAPYRRTRDLRTEAMKFAEREISSAALNYRDRERLREAVAAELDARVNADWTPRRAERLVEALLDELWPDD